MSNQYDVLGKAPGPEDLKKLSPNEYSFNNKKFIMLVMEKWKFFMILI